MMTPTTLCTHSRIKASSQRAEVPRKPYLGGAMEKLHLASDSVQWSHGQNQNGNNVNTNAVQPNLHRETTVVQ